LIDEIRRIIFAYVKGWLLAYTRQGTARRSLWVKHSSSIRHSFIRFTKPSRRSMPVRLVWSWMTAATSPELPISAASLSAASPAAAMLSVA
jgi:hypothetical protein